MSDMTYSADRANRLIQRADLEIDTVLKARQFGASPLRIALIFLPVGLVLGGGLVAVLSTLLPY